MTWRMYCGYEPFTIRIDVETQQPQTIMLKVYDEKLSNTVFTNRFMVITGKKSFFVRMPLTGLVAVIDIYNEINGNTKSDSSFKVTNIVKVPLTRKMDVVDLRNPDIKSYIKFSRRFCFNAGVAPTRTYNSSDGRFSIIYSPKIVSSESGKVLNTPARINKDTGQIEVAQDKFLTMTVPMRMAILLHEFSHFYLNAEINDETEADKNALMIYLGLGYPRIEACEAFLDTFIKSSQGPTPLTEEQLAVNSRRYNIIHKYIQDFEKNNLFFKD